MVTMNLKVSDYASRVLGVVKEKYGLRDKSQALDKFTELHGEEFVEKEASDEYVKKILCITEDYFHKHPNRRMTDKELDALCGL
ncbi:Uncharacterised protein [uncultured archaeon]|nr:Uncharacterised protein [uncultured archaeon]